MNLLWGGMLLIGIMYGTITGNVQEITDVILRSAKEAVTLCVSMGGIMAFWAGLMKIAECAGLIERITQKIKPFLHFLFPQIADGSRAQHYISVNMIANFLGLGWAATPAGLQAMEELGRLEDERRMGRAAGPVLKKGVASNEMCTFLIINISSLQLIPVNVIAYRSQYGSVNPAAIVGAGIAATAVSTGAAILYCRWKNRSKIQK